MLETKYYPELICRYLGINFNRSWQQSIKLKTSTKTTDNADNSRYIYWSRFVLKGIIADWIYHHIEGSGTELQQFHGNCTSDKWFQRLCKILGLHHYVSQEVLESSSHLIAQGFIGWALSQASPDRTQAFILKFFIQPNDNILPSVHRPKDEWQMLLFLAQQQGWQKPHLEHRLIEDESGSEFEFSCTLAGQSFRHQSSSFRYAKKKAIRLALKSLIEQCHESLENDESYINRQRKYALDLFLEKEKDRLERIGVWQQKQEKKRVQKQQKKADNAARAAREDQRRRSQKKMQKEKVVKKQSVYRDYSDEEIANMTAGKRRRLEDLGILPKTR